MTPPLTPTEWRDGWKAWNEATWQRELLDLACNHLGWAYFHPYRSYKSPTGFPDLVLCKRRVIFAELKTYAKSSKPTPAQVEWLNTLRDAGAEVYLWRPQHLDEITRILTNRTPIRPVDYPYAYESAWT